MTRRRKIILAMERVNDGIVLFGTRYGIGCCPALTYAPYRENFSKSLLVKEFSKFFNKDSGQYWYAPPMIPCYNSALIPVANEVKAERLMALTMFLVIPAKDLE
jgi:hypothetical protein